MSASARALHGRFISLASAWPRDPLRPTAQFGLSIRAAADRAFLASPPSETQDIMDGKLSNARNGVGHAAAKGEVGAGSEDAKFKQLTTIEESNAERALSVLQALKDGSANSEFPTPSSILRPASHPEYYDQLLQTIQKASQGQDVSPSFGQRVKLFFGMR
ncbi:hypothetical protein CBOM_05930 [Ceraceosorus bombacis]|uniref:Uncharacterized protein n=1 Tax=Ceraceosorus bombacis TaxID=401625 RepID=A0A0P1BJG3_9BASI|nr:hypothetical protein CBOM_05930 [Ceraceosorus bombacis]